MPTTFEPSAPKPVTAKHTFIFRFASTIALWSIALLIIFSGYELAFFALTGSLGLLSLWEFYGMLDHKDLPNFKITAMISGAIMLCGAFITSRNSGRRTPTTSKSRSCSGSW